MLGFSGPMADCPVEKECLVWAHKYLKDCVCDFRDEVSLVLGLLSVFSWGVAEVPQIITNFREKSTEGVSLAFLMTWVVGDIFNLGGCVLEPATLPTQFYMAVLYTFTTLILVAQTVYYDYLYFYFHPKLKYEHEGKDNEDEKPKPDVEGQQEHRVVRAGSDTPSEPIGTPPASSINVPHSRRSSRSDLYYTSARSLASSFTPTMGSYLVGSRESSGHATQSLLRQTSHDPPSPQPSHGSQEHFGRSSGSGAGSAARAAAGSILLVGSVALSSNFLSGGDLAGFAQAGVQSRALRAGRSLLQVNGTRAQFFPVFPKRSFIREGEASGPWGEIFGWCMAAIYMGGRLPQIMLNIKRGTVEGLSPLMFTFALVGNATYVGSILVRTMEWGAIKPNLPWLVDAGVCVALDFFIILQFVYYTMKTKQGDEDEKKKGNYESLR